MHAFNRFAKCLTSYESCKQIIVSLLLVAVFKVLAPEPLCTVRVFPVIKCKISWKLTAFAKEELSPQ